MTGLAVEASAFPGRNISERTACTLAPKDSRTNARRAVAPSARGSVTHSRRIPPQSAGSPSASVCKNVH
jgi:hypothetical protein